MRLMKIAPAQLPPLPASVLESITPSTLLNLTTNFNNTPEEDSDLKPGEKTYVVDIDGQSYAATEDEVGEIYKRKGLEADSKRFLVEKFPHLFGNAQA